MILEREITIVRKELVKFEFAGTPYYREKTIKVIARGCTQIELDRDEERLRKYYQMSYVNTPRKTLGTHKVSTQNKSFSR